MNHPDNTYGYNNEVIIAASDAAIGHNPGINESEPISGTKGDKAFQEKTAEPAGTVHRGPLAAEPPRATAQDVTSAALWLQHRAVRLPAESCCGSR